MTRAAYTGKLSGNGLYTSKCHQFFKDEYGFNNPLLTTSCTDALEMSAILADVNEGDEVIMPSYTFVSCANAFLLRGAKIIFADVEEQYPNIDIKALEELISPKTKAVIVVHYGGAACNMDPIMDLARKHNFFVVEDSAHAIDSCYNDKPLGSIGHFGTFSFHDTKNIISGEGGMLTVNDEKFIRRSEIIWEKGTNRVAFSNGQIDKYGWVDIGSSFLPSEITASFLFAQLEGLKDIQKKRRELWQNYYNKLVILEEQGYVKLPHFPSYSSQNGNMFFIETPETDTRNKLIEFLKIKDVHTVFHYLPLHKSEFFRDKYNGPDLSNTDKFAGNILRLPFYTDLSEEENDYVVDTLKKFFKA